MNSRALLIAAGIVVARVSRPVFRKRQTEHGSGDPCHIRRSRLFTLIVGLFIPVHALAAEDPAPRVVILANSRQPESVALAEFYAEARAIPRENIIALPLPEVESITWRQFVDEVHQPLQEELVRRQWLDATLSDLQDAWGRRRAIIHGHRIAFLVVCRGVPLRIHHDPTVDESRVRVAGERFATTQAALDGELALLARTNTPARGFLPNPLFGRARPTSLESSQVVRVIRLDGPDWEDARRLVTSALAAERQGIAGRYYVDRHGPHADGDRWLDATRAQLDELGFEGAVEGTGATFAPGARFDAPLWYFGWYAGNIDGPFTRPDFRFPAGAVAVHIHSFSAATLHNRDSGWTGPLVARGVTATVGNVFEPYLQLTHRPDLLVRALAAGRTFGEAAYEALPVLGWQAIAVGDPLYRPFGTDSSSAPSEEQKPYAAIRAANLHWAAGDRVAAVAGLQAAMLEGPSLPLVLALGRRQRELGQKDRAVATLAVARPLREFRGDDWHIGREIARELVALGDTDNALSIYRVLAHSAAPAPEDMRSLLEEARTLADKSGDLARSLEFARRLNEAEARK